MFNYERNGIIKTLPFNPELCGFLYSHCKCEYVKFKKIVDDREYQLSFYTNKKKVNLDTTKKEGNRAFHESTRTLQGYPANQIELEHIIATI